MYQIATVIYGKVDNHETYPDAKECCREQASSGYSFCNRCGIELSTLKEIDFDELYPNAYRYSNYDVGDSVYLIGKEVYELLGSPVELKSLSKEQEDKVNEDLGGNCKYLLFQEVD